MTRFPISMRRLLTSVLLFCSCAGWRRSSLERHFRDEAIAGMIYRVPAAQLRGALRALVAADGYRWPKGTATAESWTADSTAGWTTEWRCGGSSCDRLTIALEDLGAVGISVTIIRTRYETGQDFHLEERSRAYDVEWSLLERLDPKGAHALEAEVRSHGNRVMTREAAP